MGRVILTWFQGEIYIIMKALNTKILTIVLFVGLLSACASRPADIPTASPTQPATETPTLPPPATDTAVATDTAQPTDIPTEEPTSETVPPSTGVSFANDILPILQSRCLNCHGGDRLEEGLSLKTYDDLMSGSDNGLVVTAGNADNSLLIELISTQKMPKRGPKLTPDQIRIIIDWVNEGALNN